MEHQLGPVIADIAGLTLTQEDIEFIKHPNLGGLILFARNYESPKQVSELIKHIRSIRPHFFICVDQEGGPVQRFQEQFSKLPSMNQIGKLFDDSRLNVESTLSFVKKIGYLMAIELRAVNIDMSFAPVLDLATWLNPIVKERAIHHDPAIVSLVASHYMDGMSLAGMPACGKHFPGHGKVNADSHLSLPIDERDFQALKDDLQPFEHLIKHGIQSIMPGHLIFPAIDKMPATFSTFWLRTLLREKMKFRGAIICDDLNMDATKEIGNMLFCANQALEAGCDFILVCNNRPQAEQIVSGVKFLFEVESLTRRQKVLANNQTVSWEALSQHPKWIAARQALDQFNALSQ